MTQKTDTRDTKDTAVLKLYSMAILLLDILIVLFKSIVAIFEAIYLNFFPPPEESVVGEIVLITGTGHGIGRELALQYCAHGATVVGVDINEKGNTETEQLGKERGYKSFHTFTCDISQRQNVTELGKKVKAKVGDVTIIVNNAGIMPCHPLKNTSEEEIRKIFDVNVFSHFWVLETFLPSMMEKNHGHIVGISSMAGVVGLPNLVPYCASKFAVRGYMEALAEELREDARNSKIKFTSIFPFMVDTGLCKNPKIKFPSLMGLLQPKDVASHIIRSQRRGEAQVAIPNGLLHVNNFCRLMPLKVARILKDFLDSGVDSDLL
uniref:Short-chain dehydrogenase/reductase 3 n=1 Tax=Cacopsylla melanoneura TaxID=428564 RepID=A0A8D9EGY2_9HEMI